MNGLQWVVAPLYDVMCADVQVACSFGCGSKWGSHVYI